MKGNIGRGDCGKTQIVGRCLDKASPLIGLLGLLDELNSLVGLSRSFLEEKFKDLDEILEGIQSDIFLISSELAGAKLKKTIDGNDIKKLEEIILRLEKELKPIKNFIYPTGSKVSSLLHTSRAFCRRVEREAFLLSKKRKLRKDILSYLNRLSDVLFTIAMVANRRLNIEEKIWKI